MITQRKAKIRAVQKGYKSVGQYLTDLLEADCKDIELEETG